MGNIFMSDSLEGVFGEAIKPNQIMISKPLDGLIENFGVEDGCRTLCFTTKDLTTALKIFDGKTPPMFIITYDESNFKHEISFEKPEIYIEVISKETIKVFFKEPKENETK